MHRFESALFNPINRFEILLISQYYLIDIKHLSLLITVLAAKWAFRYLCENLI